MSTGADSINYMELPGAELAEILRALHEESERFHAQWLAALAVFDSRGDCLPLGTTTTASWL